MKRVLCGLLMALASHTVLAEEIVTPAEPFTGWSWYNEPKKPPEQSRKPQQPRRRLFRISAKCPRWSRPGY